jgi:hypothetical protein
MHTRLGETNAASAASNDRLPWEHSQPSFMRWDGRVRCRTNWKSGAAGGASASPHHRWAYGASDVSCSDQARHGAVFIVLAVLMLTCRRVANIVPRLKAGLTRTPAAAACAGVRATPSPTVLRQAWSAHRIDLSRHGWLRTSPSWGWANHGCVQAAKGHSACRARPWCGKSTGNGSL